MAYHNWNELSESTQNALTSRGHTPDNRQQLDELGGVPGALIAAQGRRLIGNAIRSKWNPFSWATVGSAAAAPGIGMDADSQIGGAGDYSEPSVWNPIDWGIRWMRGVDALPDWLHEEWVLRNEEWIRRNHRYLSENMEYVSEEQRSLAVLAEAQEEFLEANGRYASSPQELMEWGGLIRYGWKGVKGLGRWLFKPTRENLYVPGAIGIPAGEAIYGNAMDMLGDYGQDQDVSEMPPEDSPIGIGPDGMPVYYQP